jgi:cytochrome c-type biogenesis protein CcmE
MLLNNRNSDARLRTQRALFSLWMALAAVIVIITMAAGLATTSHAADIDYIKTSAIASAPISKASDRILVIGLVIAGFVTMAVGGLILTFNSIRETSWRHRRH